MLDKITRSDGSTVSTYASGDGHLSFTVSMDGLAQNYDVTDDEARQICPYGWLVYKEGPYHRARPAS